MQRNQKFGNLKIAEPPPPLLLTTTGCYRLRSPSSGQDSIGYNTRYKYNARYNTKYNTRYSTRYNTARLKFAVLYVQCVL